MRGLVIVSLCLAAACSQEAPVEKKAASDGPMLAGGWEVSSTVDDIQPIDKTKPAIKAAKGDKATAPGCIEAGKEDTPPPELFAGEGYSCAYKDHFMRSGIVNATLDCERKGLEGRIMMTVEGSFTPDSFKATTKTRSYLATDGDFTMTTELTGRHTGPTCPAPTAKAKA